MFVCLLFVCLFVCLFGLLLLGYTAWKHALGCNNGCGSGNLSKVKWLAATVSCKVDWNTETVIIWGFTCTGGRRERKKKRKKEKKRKNQSYLPLFTNMQEYWDSDIFWFDDSRICGGFPPLCIL